MIGLIRKRHADGSWAFFTELANSTGGNVKGFADAFAIGIWPSRGYEAHCYEIKQSREDLKKELKDPTKADTVGKYADYFWLVVSDEKLIETLVIPEGWGILAPKGGGDAEVLKVVRKAPKREAAPWTRGFCAAIVRHVNDRHVTKTEHEAVKETAIREAKERLKYEATYEHTNTKRAYDELKKAVDEFKVKSGVDVVAAHWQIGNIAEAVKTILAMQFDRNKAEEFLRVAEQHEAMARRAREAAALLTPKSDDS